MFCPNCGKKTNIDMKFCSECGHELKKEDELNKTINNPNANDENIKEKNNWWLIFVIIGILSIFANSDDTSPRTPDKLECVEHNRLCIATTDVKYDYTNVKTKTYGYPAYGKEWNNGWASAQKSCEAWGGRLPYIEDFVTIVDAFNHNKIKLEDYKSYLSGTQINTYRIWAYSHNNNYAVNGYNNESIFDSAISIEKSGDWIITGHYGSGTAYTWSARCVKDL